MEIPHQPGDTPPIHPEPSVSEKEPTVAALAEESEGIDWKSKLVKANVMHVFALMAAVFFVGVYLRGEAARKGAIKEEIAVIRAMQSDIMVLVDSVQVLSARKDTVLLDQIRIARENVDSLDQEAEHIKARLDILGQQIAVLQVEIDKNVEKIRNARGWEYNVADFHSVALDPDIQPEDSVKFNAHERHTGESISRFGSFSQPIDTFSAIGPPGHLEVAQQFVGTVEDPRNSNRGPAINRFLASVGLKPVKLRTGEWKSYPYCAAFVSFCLNEAPDSVAYPLVRSAKARDYVTNESIEANKVLRGTVRIDPGTLVVWKRNRNPQDTSGHVGFVVSWEGQAGTTIEGNTSSGQRGNQRDGDGVYMRKRMLSPASAFRITHFTPVLYNNQPGRASGFFPGN